MKKWRCAGVRALAAWVALLASPLGAQDNPIERTEDLSSVTTLEGACGVLIVSGDDVTSHCDGVILNPSYNDGRMGFVFLARDMATATFTGQDGTVSADGGTIYLDRVILATLQNNKPKPITLPANGTCVYSIPDIGPAKISCIANTNNGAFTGSFTSNGKPPKTRRF